MLSSWPAPPCSTSATLGGAVWSCSPIRATYWPHAANFRCLHSSSLDWRLLFPARWSRRPPVGLARLRVSVDRLPVELPAAQTRVPDPLLVARFTERVPALIVPYADAAALMLANLQPESSLARHRIGLALPLGMRGMKAGWAPPPATEAVV